MYTSNVTRSSSSAHTDALGQVPDSVRAVADTLTAANHEAYLVGGCIRDRLLGRRVYDFDLATSAGPTQVLELLPSAVPIGLRHGTVMVPTSDGPVDVTRFRAGGGIEADLAHRDFTINAMAYDFTSQKLLDPLGGLEDLHNGRLRAVGSASDRFDEDPLRGLRAARLVATLDLELDPEIEPALAKLRERLRSVARERIRGEFERLLLGPRAERGLALLVRSGIANDLFGELRPDAVAVVAALPQHLELRLAGWLRGVSAERVLARLRFPRRTAKRVGRLLDQHPIGAGLNPKRDVAIRRLIRQVGADDIALLDTLRSVEINVAAGPEAASEHAKLAALEAAIERVQQAGELALRRFDLALDGREVMRMLDCGPGRTVGLALRHLTEAVIEEPSRNTPAELQRLLVTWAEHRA
ncbi:MAG: [cytidine(C)-cytidine(C)-adenosine (A)]-adding enzyme [Deltaproteobacteria bacterium]|nr:[cytidine(C)-cytidine(C)-adenosine (A)]-adding enzyme [Deltaproteobacteria bacterium]